MTYLQRLMKFGYVLALGTTVFVLSKPAPVRAQRTIAYAFIPGTLTNSLGMSLVLGTGGSPFGAYMRAQQMLMQAGSPLDTFGVGQSGGMGLLGNTGAGGGRGGGMMGMMGMGGMGGMGGMMGMGGGMMGMRGGMGGMGGMMGMGGMGMGGMRGGMGGFGGFAGKGFGGFNGKKAL